VLPQGESVYLHFHTTGTGHSSGILLALTGLTAGTGALPQGTKCADSSKLREYLQPKRQDSPQELPDSVRALHAPSPQGPRAGTPSGAGLSLTIWSYQDRRDLVQRCKFKPSNWQTLRL
jgi:hypothetical protein